MDLNQKQKIFINIIDWFDSNDTDYKYTIYLFGRNENGQSVSLKINEFYPFFFVLIPEKQNQQISDEQYKENFSKTIEQIISKYSKNLIQTNEEKKYIFRGFNNYKLFNFLVLRFNNSYAMTSSAYLLNSLNEYQIFESNIPPLLRFIHMKEIYSCGWIQIEDYQYDENSQLSCHINLQINYQEQIKKNIKNDKNQKKTNFKYLWQQNIKIDLNHKLYQNPTKFIICSFDIECTSIDGNFPQAIRDGDQIIQIGIIFNYYKGDIYKKYMLSIIDCDDIVNTIVKSYNGDEKEMLIDFFKIIQKEDPDIITGYNISYFDEQYIYDRMVNLKCDNKIVYSRFKNKISKIKENKLESSALGDNILKYIECFGRVHIDLFKVIQKDYKLNSYKLDSVSENFINGKINDIQFENNILKIYINSTTSIQLKNYIKIYIQSEEDNDNYEKFQIYDIDYQNNILFINIKQKTSTIDFIIEYIENKNNIQQNSLNQILYWCLVKDDIKAKDIFKLYHNAQKNKKERKKNMQIIGDYCIQDCVLVTKLLDKLEIITNNFSMANVCYVPFSYLFLRGQGIKSYSLVSRYCRENNYLIPLNQKFEGNTNYEGAIVFEPIIGLYKQPISVLDYNSLYPTSIISRNISHETILLNNDYDNLDNSEYYQVEYKEDDKNIICRFIKNNNKLGVIPQILQNLLFERKNVRNQMKLLDYKKDYFLYSILDGQQLALKITANSLYGQLGASVSQIYFKELAACTTAIGRNSLIYAKEIVEKQLRKILRKVYIDKKQIENDESKNNSCLTKEYKLILNQNISNNDKDFIYDKIQIFKDIKINPIIVYGDSVTGDTPLLLRKSDGFITIKTIDDLTQYWKPYRGFKLFQENIYNKQQNKNKLDYEVYSSTGWTKIKRVIKHETQCYIYRIQTMTGIVDVTEGHSLIDSNLNYIKPIECNLQTKLLQNFPISFPQYLQNHNMITKDEAYILGLSFNELNNEIIPDQILNGQINVKQSFLKGIFTSILNKCSTQTIKSDDKNIKSINIKGKICSMQFYYLLQSLQYNVLIDFNDQMDENKNISQDIYKLYFYQTQKSNIIQQNRPVNQIRKIINLGQQNKYVYDIETEQGNFHAGIGNLIIKNTDSVFINFNICDKQTKELLENKKALQYSIYLAQISAIIINSTLLNPMKIEYEKTFFYWIILGKKKYTGNKYTENINKFEHISMGIVLKRRDNAQIVKKIVGQIVDDMLNGKTNNEIIYNTKNNLQQLMTGQFNMKDFIITKTLKGNYVDRTKHAHVALSDRKKQRDSGYEQQTNDRIPFIYINKPENNKLKKGEKILQGERVEDPDFIKQNNLKIDYLFYLTNQIMNPSVQFLELIINDPEKMIFNPYIIKEQNLRNNIKSIFSYFN